MNKSPSDYGSKLVVSNQSKSKIPQPMPKMGPLC